MIWLRRFILGILLVAGSVLLVAFWPLPPQLRGLAADGDRYNAEIVRDAWGVPHIFGATDADVAFGLAYAHAEDDFLTIQQGLAAARGDLARYYGAAAAPNDYMVGLLRIQDVVDAGYTTQLSAEVRALCEAYAAGLNLYAAQHPRAALRGLFPVTGKDVVAGSVHKSPLFFGLDGTLGRLFEQVEGSSAGTFNGLALAAPASGIGSNVFAVAPSHTADGSTYLAINSHQPWTGPVAWYEAHVHSDSGWQMAGALFPGMPVIVHGHNRDLGWAFTVNAPDLIDVYALTLNPANPNQYRYDGAWRDFEVRRVPIEVNLIATAGLGNEYIGRLDWTVSRDAWWSEYGPVIRNADEAYAVRYAGYGLVTIYEQLYRMNRATTFEAWRAALAQPGLPMFNVGYADRAGNIYYAYNALLPLRDPAFDWTGTLPGDTSATRWTQTLPFDALPQVLNPAAGYIQNANSTPFETTTAPDNPDPARYGAELGIERFMTNRALRLRELLGADASVTWDEFHTYKYDMAFSRASDMAGIVERLATLPARTPDEQRALAQLAAWDLQATPDSIGATIALLTLYELDRLPDVQFNPSRLVGNTLPTDAVQRAFRAAVARLIDSYGRIDVAWGEINRLVRGQIDLPLGGAPDVAHAVYGQLAADGRISGIAGDSYIMLVRWDASGGVSSESIHQFGSATLDPHSPHFGDQAPLFVARQLKPLPFEPAAVRAGASAVYRPQEGR